MLPSPRNTAEWVVPSRWRAWWKKAERLAKFEPKPRRCWHSLKRKLASDLMDLPLKVLCGLDGWRKAETVLRCYQHTNLPPRGLWPPK